MKEELKKEIGSILKEMGIENPKVNLDYAARMEMGDYSSNVAMMYAKELGKNPFDLAEEIKHHLEAELPSGMDRVDIVKPGFINFFFDQGYFNSVIKEAQKENYGKNKNLNGEKTIIEYTDPNPFKEFHIGHMMSNTIGESVSRIIESQGAKLKRANYQGDVGLQVAKAVWAMKKGQALLEAYAFGHKAYEEDESAKAEIIEINKKIYDKSDDAINEIYEDGRKKSLLYFEVLYNKLGTKFDYYFFESEVAEFGKETVEKNIGSVFEKSEGAIVFKGENFDRKLHTRVFISSEGLPMYEAKELGLSKIKYDSYPYDTSIIITANEISEYFRVLLKAMTLVFPELAQKTKHLSHGVIKLPEGKMSSRTGNIISAESLINQVKEKILTKMNSRFESERSEEGKYEAIATTEIAEIIAVGAIKYSILRQAIGGDIIFDFDKSISFEGDSGPYLQYSAVRAKSILRKVESEKSKVESGIPENWKTTNIERMIERFPSVVERAGSEYAPNYIATYLIELSSEFNSFYASHKIIDTEDPTSPYRLLITQAFYNVMISGLDLLGIKVPEKM